MPTTADDGYPSGAPPSVADDPGAGFAFSPPPKPERSSDKPRWRNNKPLYAAIDLGTNNCRLLVARPAGNSFQVVDAFSRIVRLGEAVSETGGLVPAARRRAVTALQVCARKIEKLGVERIRAVATEACRRSANCADFIGEVYETTGLALDVISSEEEARLAVLGCQALIGPQVADALVFDIGGGSTELVLVRQARAGTFDILDWTSIPWGVVSLSERFGMGELPEGAYAAMLEALAPHVEAFRTRCAAQTGNGSLAAIGTSGTVTTLTSVHLQLPSYNRRLVDGALVPSAALLDICNALSLQSLSERTANPCIGPERADLVVAGCAVLQSILQAWPFGEVRVADRGIREGILRIMMQRDGHLR